MNQYRFSIEMLTSRIQAMEAVGVHIEKQFDLNDMSPKERRYRLRHLHGMDQRLTELKRELTDLKSFVMQLDDPI